MSHNNLKINNNSFDVNSNRSESISAIKYAWVICLSAPPKVFVSGDDFLFYRGDVKNTFNSSELELIDHPSYSNYIQYVRLKADGTYRFKVVPLNSRSTDGASYTNSCKLYDQSNYISNSRHFQFNAINYRTHLNCHAIVERSGTDIDISCRIITAFNMQTAAGGYNVSSLFVERLQ